MNIVSNSDKYHAFIQSQMKPRTGPGSEGARLRPTITISRQSGSGAMAITRELADFLQARSPAPNQWMIFDKNLAETVLEEHQLPKDIAKFMPEDRVSAINDAVEEILGLHPPARTLLRHTTETILHLAALGQVILIGRGATYITRQLNNVFHVRLIAPLEQRVAQVMARSQLDDKAAREFIHKEDSGRKHYLKNYFHADIDDNLLYDMVINTARIPHHEVAHLIGEAVGHWSATL